MESSGVISLRSTFFLFPAIYPGGAAFTFERTAESESYSAQERYIAALNDDLVRGDFFKGPEDLPTKILKALTLVSEDGSPSHLPLLKHIEIMDISLDLNFKAILLDALQIRQPPASDECRITIRRCVWKGEKRKPALNPGQMSFEEFKDFIDRHDNRSNA